jgi:hypothetical protein
VAGGTRTLIAGVAPRDPVPLDDDHIAYCKWTPGRDSHPRGLGLQPSASILSHRALRCQGGDRTLARRLTAGRLAARLPGTVLLRTVTGIRTPVTGLRARRPDRWTITAWRKESESNAHRPDRACRASNAVATPPGCPSAEAGRLERPRAHTRTVLRTRLLIQPDRFPVLQAEGGRLERPSASDATEVQARLLIQPDALHTISGRGGTRTHTGRQARTRLANGLLIWPDPFLDKSPRRVSHPRPLPYQGSALLPELRGHASRRHDSNVRPPPSEGGALILLSYGELKASTAGVEPALSGFVDRRLLHSTTSTTSAAEGT